MYVVKRDGRIEDVQFDKITARIARLAYGLDKVHCDPVSVAQKVTAGVYKGVTTEELDCLAAETAATMASTHPDYSLLAARIAVSNLHKRTCASFAETVRLMHANTIPGTGEPAPLVAEDLLKFVEANAERLDHEIVHDRDFHYDYFGFTTLERSYLTRVAGRVVERPQHLFMRVACGIHVGDLQAALESYHLMSDRWFTHASPTLFNAGTPHPQLSSCFLVGFKGDSIEGIYDTLKECAVISKSAGGIGLAVHDVRATGSYIRGTNGHSNGIVPMLRVFNDTARYVDQGGGKRKGAIAAYLEPWHDDVYQWVDLRKNHGKEEMRCRDLFLGLWVPDLFMRRVEADMDWTLFCPREAPGLADVWGEAFDELYERYEREGRGRRTVRAQHLWYAILQAQVETGMPYMLYKDSCNRKSNQRHLGTLRCSNLCAEILEFTSPEETAVCNLASISLPRFVVSTDPNVRRVGSLDAASRHFDFEKLAEVVRVATRNLNRVIDINHYPVEPARRSNMRHRPIGLGVQGLADAFILLGMPFDSAEARELNRRVFECIYFNALSESCALAATYGPHDSFAGSPASRGELQPDMWGVECDQARWDWAGLRRDIAKHGLRNSLLVAPMPTASTSQILGNNESIEPYTCNMYVRRVLSGEFMVINRHLLHDLCRLGLWDMRIKNAVIAANGSVQDVPGIPDRLKELYRSVWEIRQRALVDMAADRGAFIDQTQSLNIFMSAPTFSKLTSLHFYAWRRGLKTGMYYLRTRPAADAIKFTLDPVAAAEAMARAPHEPPAAAADEEVEAGGGACQRGCMSCGS